MLEAIESVQIGGISLFRRDVALSIFEINSVTTIKLACFAYGEFNGLLIQLNSSALLENYNRFLYCLLYKLFFFIIIAQFYVT